MKPYVFVPRMRDGTDPADVAILGAHHGRPGFGVPAGACDCHVHVFGPRDRYPLAPERTFAPGTAGVDDLAAMHSRLGVERAVIVQASVQGTDNRCLVDAIAALAERGREARGVAVVAPDAPAAVLRDLDRAGVRGLRVNLQSSGQTDPALGAAAMRTAAARAAELGWHVQTYTTARMIGAIADTIARLPAPLVVDHFALADPSQGLEQPGLRELLALLRDGRVYVKLSAPYRIVDRTDGTDAHTLVRALIDANPARMLWGTDWPHTGPWPGRPREREGVDPFHPIDDGAQLDLLSSWTTAEERRRILVENAAALYGF